MVRAPFLPTAFGASAVGHYICLGRTVGWEMVRPRPRQTVPSFPMREVPVPTAPLQREPSWSPDPTNVHALSLCVSLAGVRDESGQMEMWKSAVMLPE